MNLRRSGLLAVTAVALALPGCGGSDGKGAGRPGDSDGPAPSAKAAPADASGEENVYANGVAAFERGDFDTALEAMASLGSYRDARQRLAEFRVVAARKTLTEARAKIDSAPQAAVSQARTSIKYHATAEARAFLERARKALRAFQADQRAKGEVDGAGPPSGKGPDGKGPPGKGEDDD